MAGLHKCKFSRSHPSGPIFLIWCNALQHIVLYISVIIDHKLPLAIPTEFFPDVWMWSWSTLLQYSTHLGVLIALTWFNIISSHRPPSVLLFEKHKIIDIIVPSRIQTWEQSVFLHLNLKHGDLDHLATKGCFANKRMINENS